MYVIAHRVNDAEKLRMALAGRANALEIDVTINEQFGVLAWHGTHFADWNSARLDRHLDAIAEACRSTAGRNICLLIIDFKYDPPNFRTPTLPRNRPIGPNDVNEVRSMVRQRVLNRVNGVARWGRGIYALYCMSSASEGII
ncbi:MAG: hypothetical protein AAF647_08355, partial [Pseudomonadota bacterium]